MSQVFENAENNGIPTLSAGNTVDTLSGTDRDFAVAPVEEVPVESVTVPNTDDETVSAEEFLDEENSFDVSRAEFTELQDGFLRLYNAVVAFNKTSPHKILGIS